MGERVHTKKITWVIKNFNSLQSTPIYSDQFVVGGCRWRLRALVKRNEMADVTDLFLILEVPDKDSLLICCGRHATFSVTLVNQYSEKLSQLKESQLRWFKNIHHPAHPRYYPTALVNGELIVVAKIDVLEVEEKLDVTEESSPVMETVDVNGFQVLPLQVESVNRLFEKEPDMASNIRPNNQYLKTAYMNVLLSLTQTLCQLPEEISNNDMAGAGASLTYLRDAGFKLDWLEKKHDELLEKKKKIEACLARLHYLDEKLKPYERKCLDELKAARIPLSLYDDDVV